MKAPHALVILFAAMLSACAPSERAEGERVTPRGESVAAPTPDEVTIRISFPMAGQVVQTPIGARFAVELIGVPTAGYVWAPAAVPEFIAPLGERGGPTTEAQRQPGFTGGSHWEVFVFETRAAGRGDLRFEQRRPWESGEPPAQTFAVTIEAR